MISIVILSGTSDVHYKHKKSTSDFLKSEVDMNTLNKRFRQWLPWWRELLPFQPFHGADR